MARTRAIAGKDGSVEQPQTADFEAKRDADEVRWTDGAADRAEAARDAKRQSLYDEQGATFEALTVALMDAQEGDVSGVEAMKAARAAARSDPEFPA